MPRRVAVSGPIVEPHGTLLRDTKTWWGTLGRGARLLEQHGGVGRRRVALVGVELDRRAVVDERGVVGIVALDVVRVHGVGVVGRDAADDAASVRWRSSREPPAARLSRSMMVSRIGPDGAGDRGRPDLLVVEQGDHRDVVVRLGGGQGGRRRPARHLVVEAAAGQQRAVGAEDGGRLDVEEPELPRRRHGGAGALGDPRREVGAEVGGPHRAHVGLAIEDEAPLVDVAIEVDGELRHAGDRLVDGDERRRAVRRDEAPGDAEVAVEPAVEQHAAVDLDAELAPPGAVDVGARLDAQVRRVGVGADEAHRQGTGTGRAAPGHEGARRGRRSRRPGRRPTAPPRRPAPKPAAASRSTADRTACHGDGEASRKARRAAVGSSGELATAAMMAPRHRQRRAAIRTLKFSSQLEAVPRESGSARELPELTAEFQRPDRQRACFGGRRSWPRSARPATSRRGSRRCCGPAPTSSASTSATAASQQHLDRLEPGARAWPPRSGGRSACWPTCRGRRSAPVRSPTAASTSIRASRCGWCPATGRARPPSSRSTTRRCSPTSIPATAS